ncbi:MAG TPA: serine protease [Polyangiaceae bacterium]|nr:serine protease [Polyangiaceae bacterium]
MIAASVVRIYATTQEPDYNNPWQAHAPSSSTGSGVVVAPGRVLTGAHVVANATFLQVQKASEPDKFTARVEAVCHCADLALLAIDEEAFNRGVISAEIGQLATPGDRVSVVGFPVGGDEVSVTEGVVSRIEVQRYSHSQRHLLAVTVDAAINQGNSGGPVLQDGKVVGIAFQKLTKAENVGEMVPAPLLRHFLGGLARGVPSPIVLPDLAAATQTLENPILRRRLGLAHGESGVLVRAVEHGGSADGVLEPGDTLLEIGGLPIANNGSILYRDRYRTRFDAILGEHFVGDKIPVRFLRDGAQQRRLLELKPSCRLVPRNQYDRSPTYFVYGGLVFQPLTRDFLATWEKWWEKAPEEFVHLYHAGVRTEARQEVIVLSQVLADAVNVGYERRINESVATVNGVPPRDMRDFVRLLSRAQGTVEIRLSSNSLIVLDVPALSEARHRILARYRVSADRSSDLGDVR